MSDNSNQNASAAHHSIATCNGNGAHIQTPPKPISEKRKAFLERMDKRKREAATPLEYSLDPTVGLKKVSMHYKAHSCIAVSVDHACHFS